MPYRNTGHAQNYKELKEQADLAYKQYTLTKHELDWDHFMSCEMAAANYAEDFEYFIWETDSEGDTYVGG